MHASFVKQIVAKYFYVFTIRISLWPSLVLHGQHDGHSNEQMAAMPKDRRMCMCVLHSLVFVECLHPSVAGGCTWQMLQLYAAISYITKFPNSSLAFGILNLVAFVTS